jgi:hypothetical protein
MLERCWAKGAFLACSGSGMVSLLTVMRSAPPNGFALWDTATHVQLGGQPPSPAAALAMARRIHDFYAASWAEGRERVSAVITPERCVEALARVSHGDATSPRPALMAHLLALTGDATQGSAEFVWRRALRLLLHKLREESAHDAAVALERLPMHGLLTLRQLADGSYGELSESSRDQGVPLGNAFDVALLLCEDKEDGAMAPPLLMPPYGALLRNWITFDGRLAISSNDDGGQGLRATVRNNLKALHTLEPRFSDELRDAVSVAVLRVMVCNSIGIEVAGRRPGAALRAPRTLEEFVAVPAIACVFAALEMQAAQAAQRGQRGRSPSVARPKALLLTPADSPERAE